MLVERFIRRQQRLTGYLQNCDFTVERSESKNLMFFDVQTELTFDQMGWLHCSRSGCGSVIIIRSHSLGNREQSLCRSAQLKLRKVYSKHKKGEESYLQ